GPPLALEALGVEALDVVPNHDVGLVVEVPGCLEHALGAVCPFGVKPDALLPVPAVAEADGAGVRDDLVVVDAAALEGVDVPEVGLELAGDAFDVDDEDAGGVGGGRCDEPGLDLCDAHWPDRSFVRASQRPLACRESVPGARSRPSPARASDSAV